MNDVAYCFDLDGTLSTIEILPAIAAEIGVAEEVETLTRATMDGHLSFPQSLRLRALVLGSVPLSRVHSVVADLPLDEHLSSFIRERPDACFVVTGNLDVWLEPMLTRLGCDVAASRASRRDGHLRVDQVMDKGRFVRELAERGFSRVIAVGDGANDVPMFREASTAIAFGGVHSPTRSAIEASDYVVHEGGDLCRLLQGLS
jgi:HAD superfamily phosphoserine phosphatase-like hydrolase